MNLPCPLWLDALLIAPFRWPASPYLGMWLGSTLLALWCLILGYVFVLLSAYIAEKLVFSRLKRHLPLFARIEAIKQADRERRGPMRPF